MKRPGQVGGASLPFALRSDSATVTPMLTESGDGCAVCGIPARDDARFCKGCGAALRPPPACPVCGTEVPPTAVSCESCAARLVGARPQGERIVVPPAAREAPKAASETEASDRAVIEAALSGRKAGSSGAGNVLANVLLAAGLLAAVLVIIRVANKDAAEEVSPFEGGPPPGAGAMAASGGGGAVPPGEGFSGTVQLTEGLRPPAGATLFVIVRPQGAPNAGPPLAVKRLNASSFPVSLAVGPGDTMMGMPFEGPFDVYARLDADGNAMTKAPGDLFASAPASANPGDATVRVVLDQAIP